MPLDSQLDGLPVIATQPSVLDRIRLTPVPTEVAIRHRKTVIAAFRIGLAAELPEVAVRARMKQCRWHMLQADPMDTPAHQLLKLNHDVFRFIAVHDTSVILNGRLGEGIPPSVMTLTKQVRRRLDGIGLPHHIQAQVFFADPIMWVVYRDGNDIGMACLAIWDITSTGPVIHEIATLA